MLHRAACALHTPAVLRCATRAVHTRRIVHTRMHHTPTVRAHRVHAYALGVVCLSAHHRTLPVANSRAAQPHLPGTGARVQQGLLGRSHLTAPLIRHLVFSRGSDHKGLRSISDSELLESVQPAAVETWYRVFPWRMKTSTGQSRLARCESPSGSGPV